MAPKEPLATAVSVNSSTTSVIESSTTVLPPTDESSQLVKAMEEMSLKTNEINRLTKIIENLEKTNKSTQIDAKIHEENAHKLSEEVKKLQKELTLKDQIAYIKNYLWNNVIESIHDVWPSIQVIFEKRELLLVAQTEIQKTQEDLVDKPE